MPKRISCCRLPIADCRLPIADCRLPIARDRPLRTLDASAKIVNNQREPCSLRRVRKVFCRAFCSSPAVFNKGGDFLASCFSQCWRRSARRSRLIWGFGIVLHLKLDFLSDLMAYEIGHYSQGEVYTRGHASARYPITVPHNALLNRFDAEQTQLVDRGPVAGCAVAGE